MSDRQALRVFTCGALSLIAGLAALMFAGEAAAWWRIMVTPKHLDMAIVCAALAAAVARIAYLEAQ